MNDSSKGYAVSSAMFSLADQDNVLAKISIGNDAECWNWSASKDPRGYGLCSVQKHTFRAHRVVYAIAFGVVPRGMFVCHRCDNPSCCNPSHLFLGTTDDNMADKVAKGRQSRGPAHAALIYERSPKGSNSHNAKLTEASVREIRELRRSGQTVSHLARTYGVTRTAINSAIHGRSWRHV